MKRFVCAVYDSAALAFGSPFFVPALGAALRSFGDEVNRKAQDNQLALHPDDFALHVLAMFDDESGLFESVEGGPRVLARGKDLQQ